MHDVSGTPRDATTEYVVIGNNGDLNGAPTAIAAHAQVLYNSYSGELFWDANGTGDGGQTHLASVIGAFEGAGPDLEVSHFTLLV